MRMIDEVGLKEKPEDTKIHQKDYMEIRSEAPGGTLSQLCDYWDCTRGKCRCVTPEGTYSGGLKYHGQVAPTTGSLILVPPRPKEMFKVFEPKLVERILLP